MRIDDLEQLGHVRTHDEQRGESKQVVLNLETPPLDTGPMMRTLAAGLAEVVREIRQLKVQVNVAPADLIGLERVISKSIDDMRDALTANFSNMDTPVINVPKPDMTEVKALAKQVERAIEAMPKAQAAKLTARGLSGEMRVMERSAYGDITKVAFTIKPSKPE
jgi:hypothetical protein